jgi:hypothetical protein
MSTYKNTQVYVVMRQMGADFHPVAVFTDLETAEGNAEGYNLSMEEQKLDIHFYVTTTMMYE